MPLDTGAFADSAQRGEYDHVRRPRPTLDPDLSIGMALRAAREGLGLTLEQIADTTRIRVRHLQALETGELDQLPSRPFTVGYVRAYAKALGLDADSTAARFRLEHPSPEDDELRTPVGVQHERGAGRNNWIFALIGLAVLGIVGWNVTRHLMAAPVAKVQAVAPSHAAALAQANTTGGGPFSLQAPLPAPAEATAPAPYVTPIVVAGEAAAATKPAPAAAAAPTPFIQQGTIYGKAAGASQLIIQAKKSISLEVRGAGGVVYFARELSAGEAYRVPALPGLTAEVSNPDNAMLYEGGISKGAFTAAQMPLKTVG
jgi:transcriptional regulator with XRE-family HTH domain